MTSKRTFADYSYFGLVRTNQRRRNDFKEYSADGFYIEDVFSSHQAVIKVRRKGENIIFNVSKGVFPSLKKV